MLAVPLARLTLCAPGEPPTVASPGGSAKLIGRPSKAGTRLAAETAAAAESVSSEAVMVEVVLGCTTWAGLAVAVSTSRGETVGLPDTLSQPAVPGPVLQPHQFSVAFTEPDSTATA